ncbi:MAG: hypothetical protein IKF80_06830 [Erysipelotrichaceae bacterium]|nr:hypothetical protein [Erysipelotrichaceae bacterium]
MCTGHEDREQDNYEITRNIFDRLGTFADDGENERLIKNAKMTNSFENMMYVTLGPERTILDEETYKTMSEYERKKKEELISSF